MPDCFFNDIIIWGKPRFTQLNDKHDNLWQCVDVVSLSAIDPNYWTQYLDNISELQFSLTQWWVVYLNSLNGWECWYRLTILKGITMDISALVLRLILVLLTVNNFNFTNHTSSKRRWNIDWYGRGKWHKVHIQCRFNNTMFYT